LYTRKQTKTTGNGLSVADERLVFFGSIGDSGIFWGSPEARK